MKKTGLCPKCGGEPHVITMGWSNRIGATIATGAFSTANVDHYVCASCGYVESYVKDREKLDEIAEKWPRWGP